MTTAIIHAIVLGFGLILPLGPQNTFILAQGASQPSLVRALPAVAAAGLCDTLLILMAVFGVSLLVNEILWLRTALVVGGVGFLVFVGVHFWRANGLGANGGQGPASARRQVMFAASVSLLNPHAISDTIGVIGTSSLVYQGEERIAFAATCVAVSWIFFLSLAVFGRALSRIRGVARLLARASAVVMWISAVYLGATLWEF